MLDLGGRFQAGEDKPMLPESLEEYMSETVESAY